MSEPIEKVVNVEYTCPDCGHVYCSRESYDRHLVFCNPGNHALAESIVGRWLRWEDLICGERSIHVGRAVGVVDYHLVSVYVLNVTTDYRGYMRRSKDYEWTVIRPDLVTLFGSEEEARAYWRGLMEDVMFQDWERMVARAAWDIGISNEPEGEGGDE